MPAFPQHYSYIRLAEIAYNGTPDGYTEQQMLQNSVDLVITGSGDQPAMAQQAPNTPQLLYANYSSIYGSLLTDWLSYANANGVSPEAAFFHVTQATPFSGNSPPSLPVDWFWGVYRGGGLTWQNLTQQARNVVPGTVSFASYGDSLDIGYPEPFMQFNISMASAAGSGWSYTLEYPTAVNAYGQPTAWNTLTPNYDSTAGLAHGGTIAFDPPTNWVPVSVAGSAPLYYVRFRTTGSGTPPVAATILGRDYVGAGGTTSGVIPAFDWQADTDHDGYLNAAEWANRRPGFDARFAYESRLFAPGYGQMRFATNPADPDFRAWAVLESQRQLAGQPGIDGLFIDNSSGAAPAPQWEVGESEADYSSNYAAMVADINHDIAPHWVVVNTAGGGSNADAQVQNVPGWFEEFGLQPMAGTYWAFDNLAAEMAERNAAAGSPRYAILDSTSLGGSPSDPRTQIATLAEYYLLADPTMTFLDFFGGDNTTSSWAQHWSPAVNFDVGGPQGGWSLLTTGADPSNPALTYHVYQRQYSNAWVLYKPLSLGNGVAGTTDDNTATLLNLGGTYRPLLADGTLGAPTTTVWLRNGQGEILVPA
jgi:hypothetical protein